MPNKKNMNKIIVVDDFITKTSLAFKQCCCNVTNVIPDDDRSNNSIPLKNVF